MEPQVDHQHVASDTIIMSLPEHSSKDMRTLQLDYPAIGAVLLAVEAHELPAAGVVAHCGPEFRHLLQLWDHLSVDDGLLKRQYESIG